jgi:acetylornithine/N-succinyldiaminopimelate aminotransferase
MAGKRVPIGAAPEVRWSACCPAVAIEWHHDGPNGPLCFDWSTMNAVQPKEIVAASPHVMNTYGRVPIALSHGDGCHVWDVNGKRYLDALAGIAVNTLGHNHPRLVPALQDQLAKLIHTSNYYHIPHQETLAAQLVELSGMTNVFFCSTGLEANEAALKLARKFGHDKGIERPQIVVYENAFHGRSIATLSATGNPKVQAGFGPLVEGFIRVPLNDIEALRKATEGNSDVVALFFEAIQGEGGIHPMRAEYLRQVRTLCDERDWLLMIDEVQCGMGRTGKWFAHQWAGIVPDVMPLAKGLGSGVPIGAVVAGPRAAKLFAPGNHGTTFGGNPLAMRAGIETLRIMQEDDLLANATRVGDHMRSELARQLADELKAGKVKEIRGLGLMIGVELDRPCGALVGQCADAGLLISVTADSVVRLLPPLIMTTAQADEVLRLLCPLIKSTLAAAP